MPAGSPSWADSLDTLGALEGELSELQLRGLHEALDLAGIDRDAWLSIPALRQVYSVFATLSLLSRLSEEGLCEDRALLEVERRLGIPQGTLRSWLHRWGRQARAVA